MYPGDHFIWTECLSNFNAAVYQFMFVETFYLNACVLYYLYQSCMLTESVPFEVDNRP